MKTKTTITVETYKFSAVRLRRERPATICASCGDETNINDHVAACDRPNEMASEIDIKRIRNNNGELK